MTDFTKVKSFEELQDALKAIADNKSEVRGIIQSPLMKSVKSFGSKPHDIFKMISAYNCAFEITDQELTDLMLTDPFLKKSTPTAQKSHRLVIEELKENYGLKSNAIVDADSFGCYLMEISTPGRDQKTLKEIKNLGLLDSFKAVQDSDSKLLSTYSSQLLARKFNDVKGVDFVLQELKEDFDLSLYARDVLSKNQIYAYELLSIFAKHSIKLDLNATFNDGPSIFGIIVNDFIEDKCRDKIKIEAINHQVDWKKPVNIYDSETRTSYQNQDPLSYIFKKYYELSSNLRIPLLELIESLPPEVDLAYFKGNQDNSPLDKMSRNGAGSSKHVVKAIAKTKTSFDSVLVKFKNASNDVIINILKAYQDHQATIQYTQLSADYAKAFSAKKVDKTNLYSEILIRLKDTEFLHKGIKFFKTIENFDWSAIRSDLSILEKFAQIEHIDLDTCKMDSVLHLLKVIKEKHRITLKLNNFLDVKYIASKLSPSDSPQDIFKEIESFGHEVNTASVFIEFVNSKNTHIASAIQFFKDIEVDFSSMEYDTRIQGIIYKSLTKSKSIWDLSSSYEVLKSKNFDKLTKVPEDSTAKDNLLQRIFNHLSQSDYIYAQELLGFFAKEIGDKEFGQKLTDHSKEMQDSILYRLIYAYGFENFNSLLSELSKYEIDWNKGIEVVAVRASYISNLEYFQIFIEHKNSSSISTEALLKSESLNYRIAKLFSINSDVDLLALLNKIGVDLKSEFGGNKTPLFETLVQNRCFPKIRDKIDLSEQNQKGENIVQLLAKYGHTEDIKDVLSSELTYAFPRFNINNKDANGKRVIDILAEDAKKNMAQINLARKLGSVEPEKPIESCKDHIEKLDISNGKLDDHAPNKTNAPKILHRMYEKFNLSDEEIDTKIRKFKEKTFDQSMNNKGWRGISMTIPEVIDELSKFTNASDRLNESWSFKKVVGTIIHIVEIDPDLEINFVSCLSQLKMCKLGKLINLLHVVQDVVIEGRIVDYSKKSLGDFSFLAETVLNNVKEKYSDKADDVIAKLWSDMKSKEPPEAWSPQTQVVKGIFNKVFSEALKVEKDASYHFSALQDRLIEPLIDSLGQGDSFPADFKEWQKSILRGNSNILHKMLSDIKTEVSTEGDLSQFNNPELQSGFAFGLFSAYPESEMLDFLKWLDTQTKEVKVSVLEILSGCSFSAPVEALIAASEEDKLDVIVLSKEIVHQLVEYVLGDDAAATEKAPDDSVDIAGAVQSDEE